MEHIAIIVARKILRQLAQASVQILTDGLDESNFSLEHMHILESISFSRRYAFLEQNFIQFLLEHEILVKNFDCLIIHVRLVRLTLSN